MQTTEIVENSDIVLENVPLTQVEDDMSDIPGIRVSMATIVELSPLEEQKKLFDENASTVSEKIIDEIFSNINTFPERQQQINPSEVQNQREQELQFTELTEGSVKNETSDVPPIVDITNETDEDSNDNEIILTSENSVISAITENIERPTKNITENIIKSNKNVCQNSSISQRVQNVQSTQQFMTIDQDISQQPSEQKSEQFVNDKTVQVSPIVNGTLPSIKVSPSQQLQQLSIPLVQNASGSTSEDVQQMDILNTSSDDYKNVSPPSTLTTPIDTIKKAHTIATKLFNNNEGRAVVQNQQNIYTQQGVKRPHEDNYNSQNSRDEDSYNRRDRVRYNDYGRDSKRAAYDSGTSRQKYDNGGGSGGGGVDGGGGSRHRNGLGSEKHRSNYGSHYEHSQGSVM